MVRCDLFKFPISPHTREAAYLSLGELGRLDILCHEVCVLLPARN